MTNLSNPEIFRNLHKGKPKGLDPFFDTFFPALCYFSQKITGELAQSEDIVLECFHKLWERRENFPSPSSVKAFLYISVKNASVNFIRSRETEHKRMQALGLHDEKFEQDAERLRIKAEVLRRIYEELAKLPEKCAEVMRLAYVEGFSHEEIANKLGITQSTVRNQKSRGISLLRKSLSDYEWPIFLSIISVFEFLHHHRPN